MRRTNSILHAPAPSCASSRSLAVAILAVVLYTVPAAGQQSQPASASRLQQTAFERAAPGGGQRTARFGRPVAAHVGERIEQTISLEMRMTTSVRQGNELIEKNRSAMRNAQRRVVTTTEAGAGRATAVLVRYLEASKQISVRDSTQPAGDDGAAADKPPPIVQAVQGKSYHCRRQPGEDGKLSVTDEHGHIPPMDEYEIVAQSMEMVGRANPLAEFLAEKTIAVGETIALPQEVAERLFHLGDRFGEVTQFDLTLEKIQTENGTPCAEFLARVEAASTGSSQMRLQVEGPLVVEIDSCRAVRIELSGPLGLSETRGSYSTAHQLLGTGRLKMSIASAYRDAKR